MPLWIFRIRTVAGANVAGLTLGTAVFAMFLMLTLYMQQVLTYSPMKTGVAYLAVAGTAIIWSFVASTLVTRVGVKPVLVVGMAMFTAGLVYFTQVSVDGSYAADLLPGFLLIAVGWASRSCRSRSPRWPVSVTPRPASPPGSSTRRSRSEALSASPCSPRWPPRGPTLPRRTALPFRSRSRTASRRRSSSGRQSRSPACWSGCSPSAVRTWRSQKPRRAPQPALEPALELDEAA